MQVIIKESNQVALLAAIAKWQENQSHDDYSVFITAIVFFPYYSGNVTAVVNYQVADSCYSNPIIVSEVQRSSGSSSERAVFSAMQGGTDGG